MSLRINDLAPDFSAMTTAGTLDFHQWTGDSWVLFFSHPKDFTPVCTTELGSAAAHSADFEARGVKLLGLGIESAENHASWYKDIEQISGHSVGFPMVADPDLRIAKLYGMLPAEAGEGSAERSMDMVAPVRSVFLIGPDKRIKLTMAYPMSMGRNFTELLRAVDSLQLSASHPVSTPADWQPGQDVLIAMNVSDEEASRSFTGIKKLKPYFRTAHQPQS